MKTWQVVWRIARFRPWHYVANGAAVLGTFLCLQVPGLAMREVLNLLTGDAPTRFGFWTTISLLSASGAGMMAAHVVVVLSNVPFMFSAAAMIQKNMLLSIFGRPGAAALPESPGESVSRFRGDVDELTVFPLWMNDIMGFALYSVVAISIMLSINAYITTVTFLPMVIVIAVSRAATHRVERLRRESRDAAGDVTGFIGEVFGAVQAVKVGCAEADVIRHFRRLNDVRSRTALRDRLFNEFLGSSFGGTINLGTGVILILAGQSIRSGRFTVGDFALFTFYLGFVMEATGMLGFLIARYRQAGVAIDRMCRLMEGGTPADLVLHGDIRAKDELPRAPLPERGRGDRLEELRTTGLTFRYAESGRGVEEVDFRLARGSFTVVTGRIGSGKTTLLRTLLGLLPAQSGEVIWNGQPISDPAVTLVPPRAAYVPQVPWLCSDTLRENLLMGLPADSAHIEAAVRSAVMEQDLTELEDGLETVVGPRGMRLSGGQMQRVAAARMFLRNPELLVFDDLSSALDVETEQLLWSRLFARPETTCLAVSHRRAALRRADCIYVLRDGRVEDAGGLDDLLRRCAEMQRLWKGETGRMDEEGT